MYLNEIYKQLQPEARCRDCRYEPNWKIVSPDHLSGTCVKIGCPVLHVVRADGIGVYFWERPDGLEVEFYTCCEYEKNKAAV